MIATLPVRTMRSAQEMLLNFCLTGHSSRRAFPKLALSSQLNSGSNLFQSLDFFRSILVLIFNLILAPSAPPLPSVTLIVIQAHIFYPAYHISSFAPWLHSEGKYEFLLPVSQVPQPTCFWKSKAGPRQSQAGTLSITCKIRPYAKQGEQKKVRSGHSQLSNA